MYESSCGVILDSKGPFAVCHRKVNPNVSCHATGRWDTRVRIWTNLTFVQKYFKDCVFDLCALDGANRILCEAIEAYANECQDRGVTVGPWRNETFCRKLCINE